MENFDNYLDNLEIQTRLMEAYNGNEKLYPFYVFLTHDGTIFANLIKKFTKVPYSHASITFDLSLRNMYSFGRKDPTSPLAAAFGKEDIRTGLYERVADHAQFSVYVGFVPKDIYDKMKARLQDFIDGEMKYHYNIIGLLTNLFNIEFERDGYYFCSEFVAEIITGGDAKIINKSRSLVKPYDFAKNSQFHFLTKGKLSTYKESHGKVNLKKLINKLDLDVMNETADEPFGELDSLLEGVFNDKETYIEEYEKEKSLITDIFNDIIKSSSLNFAIKPSKSEIESELAKLNVKKLKGNKYIKVIKYDFLKFAKFNEATLQSKIETTDGTNEVEDLYYDFMVEIQKSLKRTVKKFKFEGSMNVKGSFDEIWYDKDNLSLYLNSRLDNVRTDVSNLTPALIISVDLKEFKKSL